MIRLLIVDDDVALLKALPEALRLRIGSIGVDTCDSAREALRLRERAFWRYHAGGLHTLGETLDRWYLALQTCRTLLRMAANPGTTLVHAVERWKGNAGLERKTQS